MKKKSKKKNATDTTLRNNRARKREVLLLHIRVVTMEEAWLQLTRRVEALEKKQRKK